MSIRVLGIIGSGQLGSLLCQAAKKLNIKVLVVTAGTQGSFAYSKKQNKVYFPEKPQILYQTFYV